MASPEKNVCSIHGPNTRLDENENENKKDGYQMLLCTLNVNHQSIENDKCNHCLSLCVNCMYEKMKKKFNDGTNKNGLLLLLLIIKIWKQILQQFTFIHSNYYCLKECMERKKSSS